jgi:hypothetical protein
MQLSAKEKYPRLVKDPELPTLVEKRRKKR